MLCFNLEQFNCFFVIINFLFWEITSCSKDKNMPATDFKIAPELIADEANRHEPYQNGHSKHEANGKHGHLNGTFNGKSENSHKINSSQKLNQKVEEFDEEFDGLMLNDSKNSVNTLQMLNVLRKNRQLCDLVLQLDNDSQEIYCHQIILACNSKFFMEIFNNYEIEEKDIIRLEALAETLKGDKQEKVANEISDLKKVNNQKILIKIKKKILKFIFSKLKDQYF